ncbi:hypothetical protein Misp02_36070 [Microtetraspora sp. NBRC 16547]|nr:hypothetical protein Misp02_36070 [Microtetraspora sp. NBRC 16547]
MGWDLRAARMRDLSPRLDPPAIDDLYDLIVSPDGSYFAVASTGRHSGILLTEMSIRGPGRVIRSEALDM